MNHKGTKQLETDRLILRRFRLEDAEEMYRSWASDPEVTKYLTWPTHKDAGLTGRLLAEWIKGYDDPSHYNWAIELKETHQVIGNISAVRMYEATDSLDMGYCMGKAWWGNGIMPEALKAVIQFFFEEVGVNRIAACHDANNPKSGRVMEKAGMKREGVWRAAGRNNQGICDEVWYSILRSEQEDNMSEFKELVRKNRSYRGYDESRRLTKEELTELVDCARLAPSSVNAQPFRYYLAWEKEEVDRIQALTKWARALPDMTLPHPGHCPTGFIVICQDTGLGESLQRYLKDVGIVAQTMLLAAADMGLGGCMIGNFNGDEVKKELVLPENLVPMLIVAIGKPDETIVLTEAEEGSNINYYRDENDVHYVPKRKLEDIVLCREV